MKFGQKAGKMIALLTAIIVVVLFVFLLVESHEYYMTNNVWVEEDDKGLDPIMCASVGVISVLIFMILIKAKSESRNPKAVKKNFDPLAAKKFFLSSIGHHTGFLILLRIISERIVRAVVIELLPLDLSEAEYIAGHYGIFRYFLSIILVVLLISDVILATILSNIKVTTLVPNEIIHDEENDSNIREISVQNVTVNSIETVKSNNLGDADTIRCINCGNIISNVDVFCANCGERTLKKDMNIAKPMVEHTQKLCPKCNSKVKIGDIFCVSCGSKLNN